MHDLELVRELSPQERWLANGARTGDRLPDGSVMLRPADMDRMGLEELRHWLDQRILHEHATIALGESKASVLQQPALDEIV